MSTLFVDAHVHLHDCFDPPSFLNGAVDNMCLHGDVMSGSQPGVLLLTDMFGQDTFDRLRDSAWDSRWKLKATSEDVSLIALRDGQPALVLVAGRQVACAEGLELLALGTRKAFPDGMSLARTLNEIRQTEAVPVLPWGFGKWSFRRGRMVKDLITQHAKGLNGNSERLFLGDNGGRCRLLGAPRQFPVAQQEGLVILAGSDPLPFSSQERAVGRYGFALAMTLCLDKPWQSLRRELMSTAQPQTVGRLQPAITFMKQQLMMQLRKRGLLNR